MADDVEDRIKEIARQIWGEGEYTVRKDKVRAELLDGTGKILYQAGVMKSKGNHLGALEKHLRRKLESGG
jgi:hypothetical protein